MSDSSDTRDNIRPLLVVLVLTFLCYLPSLFNSFVNYDDQALLWGNPLIQKFSAANVAHVFTALLGGHYSRFNPIPFIAYMAIHQMAGFDPFWFHAVSLFVHLATTALVFFLALLLTDNQRLSFICALLFGVHPIHTEAVAWASALTHLLCAFFYFAAVYAYCTGLKRGGERAPFTISALLLFIIAGACFSGGVVTLPAVLILVVWLKRITWPRGELLRLTPFICVAAYFFALTVYTAHRADVITNPYFNVHGSSLLERVNLSVVSILHYLAQIVFPYAFTIEYPQGYFLRFSNVWATAFFAVLVLLAVFSKREIFQWRHFRFGFLFFLITIAPFLKIYSTSTSITNDRYVYIASFGLFLIAAEWADICLRKTSLMRIIVATICVYLMLITVSAVFTWRNGAALWGQMIRSYPKAYPAYLGRADYYMRVGQNQLALKDCDTALSYNPAYAEALSLKGTLLLQMRRYEEAVDVYSWAMRANPVSTTLLNKRGAAYLLAGKNTEALRDFNASIKLDANQTEPYYNRSALYTQEGHYAKAISDLRNVLRISPGNPNALERLKKLEGTGTRK